MGGRTRNTFWPLTPTGKLKTDAETLRTMARAAQKWRSFAIPRSPWTSSRPSSCALAMMVETAACSRRSARKPRRNQPSNSAFAFGLNAAFRSLIKPEPGQALVYLDFSGQEFALAAYFSEDPNMIAAYEVRRPLFGLGAQSQRHAGRWRQTHTPQRPGHVQARVAGRALQHGCGDAGHLRGRLNNTRPQVAALAPRNVSNLLALVRRRPGCRHYHARAADGVRLADARAAQCTRWHVGQLPDASERRGNAAPGLLLRGDRGIPIVAPVHDAILIEGRPATSTTLLAEMAKCMVDASRAVMGGPAVRVERSKPLLFPRSAMSMVATAVRSCGHTTMRLLAKLKQRAA